MLNIGSGFFFQLPNGSGKRVLHAANTAGLKDDVYTAALEEQGLPLEADQDVLIFYEEQRQFMQQAAQILTVSTDEDPPLVEFKTTGDPVSAENRQQFRVSAVMSGLTASVGPEEECPLLDVSCTGFSVVATRRYEVGNVVETVLRFEDEEYRGKACVQSQRDFSQGRTRYGLHCVDTDKTTGTIPKGLHRLCLSLQRAQLRRLACTE